MNEKKKVTVEALKAIRMGGSAVFALPVDDAKAIRMAESGKNLAYRYGRILECRFTAVTDYERRTLTLTKTPLWE